MELQLLKKREPFPLSDEEVIREALKAVTSYASRHTEEAFVLDDAVEWALAAVESVWRKARHYYSYRPLGIADRQELEELSSRIRQELRARACKKAMESLKSRKMLQINKATAEAVLAYELRRRGCEFFFEFQVYRVKVFVRAGEKHALSFYIWYKMLQQEQQLAQALDAVAAIAEQVRLSGLDLTAYGGWKDFTRWQK